MRKQVFSEYFVLVERNLDSLLFLLLIIYAAVHEIRILTHYKRILCMDTSSVIWISSSTCQQTLQPLSKWAFDAVFSIALFILKRCCSLLLNNMKSVSILLTLWKNKKIPILLKSQFSTNWNKLLCVKVISYNCIYFNYLFTKTRYWIWSNISVVGGIRNYFVQIRLLASRLGVAPDGCSP